MKRNEFRAPKAASRALAVVLLVAAVAASAEEYADYLSPPHRANGRRTVRALGDVLSSVHPSVVNVYAGDQRVAKGVIVTKDGHIVTKHSEIPEAPKVRLPDGEEFTAVFIDDRRAADLALIKIDPPTPLTPLSWSDEPEPDIGAWVVAPDQRHRPRLGVISAQAREIPRLGGAMGIGMEDRFRDPSLPGIQVNMVLETSPAALAGLRVGDVIESIDEVYVFTSEEVQREIKKRDAGEHVAVRVQRGGQTIELDVTLGYVSVLDSEDRNQRMSGETSNRRAGFERALQHSIPLAPNLMGGPLIDLDGRVVGLNIARFDRATTYALPARLASALINDMLDTDRD